MATLVGELTAICRVARSRSLSVGFVLCRLVADECEVLLCAVDAGFRRRGMARLLLQAAFDEDGSSWRTSEFSWKSPQIMIQLACFTLISGSKPLVGGAATIGGPAAKQSMPWS